MKVIDKSNRDILLELLQLPNKIREYDKDEQYYLIHNVVEVLEKSIFIDKYVINNENYILSKRQEETWQNALKCFQIKDYLNAYFEIIDFIDNYGNRENRNLFEIEMENVKSILKGINKKIIEDINLDEAYSKLINRLNINSKFQFWIANGSFAPFNEDSKYKEISLYENEVRIKWLGRNEIVDDEKVVEMIKNVIIKNKNQIYNLSERQKNPNGEFSQIFKGTNHDECNGSIDSLPFILCNRINNKEFNEFYNSFKDEIFRIIEDAIISENKINNNLLRLDDNTFDIYITEGSAVEDNNRRTIEIEDSKIKIYSNGIVTNIDNSDIANETRKIVLNYKQHICEYVKEMDPQEIEYTGTVIDNMIIIANKKEYCINALKEPQLKNLFYDEMKQKVFFYLNKFIEDNGNSYIRKRKIGSDGNLSEETTILSRPTINNENDVKINTNVDKDVNEKYNGISGMVSVRNILIK